MSEALIVARGLVKAYKTPAAEVRVLQGTDLEVAPGERLAIMGASGVGKSTLLHVLGTLDRADAGTLRIGGADVLALGEAERCAFRNRTLGFVFQFHHLLPEFTALENVAMPLLVARRPLAEARAVAARLLAEVGLAERASHRPGMLSGGEQQRVAVARALAAAAAPAAGRRAHGRPRPGDRGAAVRAGERPRSRARAHGRGGHAQRGSGARLRPRAPARGGATPAGLRRGVLGYHRGSG